MALGRSDGARGTPRAGTTPGLMRLLRIEMNRGRGWELRAEGRIPASVTIERIERELEAYAIQYPHRALLDGTEVVQSGGAGRTPEP